MSARFKHKPEPHTGSWSGLTTCAVPVLRVLGEKPKPCGVSLKKHPDGTWQHAPELDQ